MSITWSFQTAQLLSHPELTHKGSQGSGKLGSLLIGSFSQSLMNSLQQWDTSMIIIILAITTCKVLSLPTRSQYSEELSLVEIFSGFVSSSKPIAAHKIVSNMRSFSLALSWVGALYSEMLRPLIPSHYQYRCLTLILKTAKSVALTTSESI